MKPLSVRLAELGYSIALDQSSDADGKAILADPNGKQLGRYTAHEIIGLLADNLKTCLSPNPQ